MRNHQLKDKDLKEFKKISDEQGITYESEQEMKRQAHALVDFVDILITMDQEEKSRQKRLETEPSGYAMAGEGRSCSLCGRSVYESEGWYDKWGFKCMNCQDAVNKKKIPGSLCRDYKHEKSISDLDLSFKSNLHVQTIRKLIRQGKIKGRLIPNGPYMILRKDNPNILDVIDAEKAEQAIKTNSKLTK